MFNEFAESVAAGVESAKEWSPATNHPDLPHGEFHYSASQIDTFRGCQRKWFIDKVLRVKRTQSRYAEFGQAVHDVLEAYLTTGRLPEDDEHILTIEWTDAEGAHKEEYCGKDFTAIVLPGLKYLPAPGEAIVEGGFTMELPGLGTLKGYLDAQANEDGTVVVIDHKSTTDLRWALKGDESEARAKDPISADRLLRLDTQSVIYSVYAMEKSQVDEITARWVYYKRNPKKPQARAVEAKMRLADVAKQWKGVIETIEEMKRLRLSGAKTAAEVPYDASVCPQYGGCSYRGTAHCQLSRMDELRSFVMNQQMKDRIKAAKAKAAEAAANPAPAPEEEPASAAPPVNSPPSSNPSVVDKLKAKLKGKKAATPAPAAPEAPAPALTAPAPTAPAQAPYPSDASYPTDAPAQAGAITEFEILRGRTIRVKEFESAKIDIKVTAVGDGKLLAELDEWLKRYLLKAEIEFRQGE